MTRPGIFGWSLPPGCSTLPGEEPEEPIALRCKYCGRYVSKEVDHSEPVEYRDEDDRVIWADYIDWYSCSRCGLIKDPIGVFA